MNCLKQTKGTHYPNSSQTRSLTKVLYWSMYMKHLLSWKTFLRQISECLVIWVTKNIELESIHSEFLVVKHHTVTQIGLKFIPKSQSILNCVHHYCRKQHRKNKNLIFIEQNLVITFCLFYMLTVFHASFVLFNGRVFPFPGPSTLRIYSGFSMSQVI